MNRYLVSVLLLGWAWGYSVSAEIFAPPASDVPFWQSEEMTFEPILFVQQTGAPHATGRLLFVPRMAPQVFHSDGVGRYEAGKDYVWKPGSRLIELTATTRIPFKTATQMAPGKGTPGTLRGVLHAEGNVIHNLQTLISYEHQETRDDLVAVPTQTFARSLAKLRTQKPFKIVALGDSITEGYNASGFAKTHAPPEQPSYTQLVADLFALRFGGPVTMTNLGVAGRTSSWGLQKVPEVLKEKPDLVLLAFGMNDRIPSEKYAENTRQTIAAIHAGAPHTDIVLVSSMSDNPLVFAPGRLEAHLAVLRTLEGPNVLVADVTTPWGKLVELKAFADISGNHFNHPNDFGHRLYAEVIGTLFPLDD